MSQNHFSAVAAGSAAWGGHQHRRGRRFWAHVNSRAPLARASNVAHWRPWIAATLALCLLCSSKATDAAASAGITTARSLLASESSELGSSSFCAVGGDVRTTAASDFDTHGAITSECMAVVFSRCSLLPAPRMGTLTASTVTQPRNTVCLPGNRQHQPTLAPTKLHACPALTAAQAWKHVF